MIQDFTKLFKIKFYNVLFLLLLKVVHGVHIEPEHEVKKRSISQPLRILLHYDDSVYRLVNIHLYNSITYALQQQPMKL
jgi:hypothetical protein